MCVCTYVCAFVCVSPRVCMVGMLMGCAFDSMVGSKGLEEAAGKVCLR